MGGPVAEPLPIAAGGEVDAEPLGGARAILEQGLIWSMYEPFIDLKTGKVVGYEALARFVRPDGVPVSPGSLFALLHADPQLLFAMELAVKRHQLAHAPPGAELFVNLDPDSWAAGGEGPDNPLLDLLAAAPMPLVIEAIENLDVGDAMVSRGMIAAARARGLRIALDDVGAANSLLSFESLDEAEVLKFDRTLLRALGRPRRRAVIQALTRMARETGARTILEGVETPTDLQLAKELGVDWVQGWFFEEHAIRSPRPALAGLEPAEP
jgi:EAL domain-containing protein (putative c-di-GMP-specific phosphodiesterase class I)